MGLFGYVCEGDWRIAGSLRRRAAQQVAARDEQIGQSAGHQQTVGVLVEPAIAHLGEAKHPLDDPDRMFDPGPDLRLGAIFRPLDLIHDAAVAVTPIGEILGFWRVLPDHRALAAISLIAPHSGLLTMQQIGQHCAVGGIGRGGGHRVDQLAAAVDAKMRLHAKVPLIALLGLMHLGVTRLVGVLWAQLSPPLACISPWGPGCALNRPTWSPVKCSSARVSPNRLSYGCPTTIFLLGWTAPRHRVCQAVNVCNRSQGRAVQMTIIRIGLDTSKHVFQIHGVDENEQPVLRRQIPRSEVAKFFAKLPPTRIGLEACGASHYWARVLRGLGHEVVLLPPQYIKPYVKLRQERQDRRRSDLRSNEVVPGKR